MSENHAFVQVFFENIFAEIFSLPMGRAREQTKGATFLKISLNG